MAKKQQMNHCVEFRPVGCSPQARPDAGLRLLRTLWVLYCAFPYFKNNTYKALVAATLLRASALRLSLRSFASAHRSRLAERIVYPHRSHTRLHTRYASVHR